MDLTDLLNNIVDFSEKSKPRSKEDKDKKKLLVLQVLFMKVEN